MDIRELFRKQARRNEEKNKVPLIIDDDDDFKDSATVRKKSKTSPEKLVKRKRTRRRISDESDSENENDGSTKKRKTMKTTPTSTKTPPKKPDQPSKGKSTPVKGKEKKSSTPSKTKEKPKKKQILTVTDFFGSAPIKRSKPAKSVVQEREVTSTTNDLSKRAEKEEEIDAIPESPVDVLMQGIDDEAIAQALQKEEMELMKQKEKEVHQDEEFTKTLAKLDEKKTATSKTTPTKPPAKKLKLMMERLPVSRSPSKTPSSTPTKPTEPRKEAPEKPPPSRPTSRAKRGIKYIDDDDDWEEDKKQRKIPTVQPSVKAVTPTKMSTKGGASSSKPAKQAITPPPVSAHAHTPTHGKTSLTTPKQVSPVTKVTSTPTPPIKPTRAESYARYLHRGGPRVPGSKPIPEGAENCLQGLTFVITGVLESLEREEAADIIKKYGGKVTGSISGRTSYVVVGEEAGESKLNKARQHGTKQISEDELLDLIRDRPSPKRSGGGVQPAKKPAKKTTTASKKKSPSPPKRTVSAPSVSTSHVTSKPSITTPTQMTTATSSSMDTSKITPAAAARGGNSLLWVDKYKPKSIKSIIGQHGERSNAKKLLKWLQCWERNRETGNDGGGAKRPWGGGGAKDDGASFKAALLSGPPGVGKTTTATLVCEETGYSFIEMNASANRSKKTLQNEVASHLSCLSIDTFMGGAKHGSGSVTSTSGKRHALIMDEVDGMAGNEDRGGMQELIAMIKTTKVPIICICNDRQSTKIRSLANHCYDLKFQKPKVDQIKGAMMSVCFKEGLKIEPQAITEMVLASGQDVRQVLHNLSMWGALDKSFTVGVAKETAKGIQKHSKMSPFDVVRSVFVSKEGDRELSLNERADLFFHDYNIASLFVQENYLSARPQKAKGKSCEVMKCISKAADSICDGELVEKQIRASSRWELLPLQAYFSSVIPGTHMQGFFGKPMFPQWLGNNSKRGKHDRILQELQRHTRLATSCSKMEFGMDYLPFMSSKLTQPLLSQGVDGASDVVSSMEQYDLVREDWDSIMELAHFSGRPDIAQQIPSKVKAAFTRAYNKSSHFTHYTTVSAKKISQRRSTTDSLAGEEEYGEMEEGSSNVNDLEPDSDDEDLSSNPMIKMKSKKEAVRNGRGGPKGSRKGKGRAGSSHESERKKGKK